MGIAVNSGDSCGKGEVPCKEYYANVAPEVLEVDSVCDMHRKTGLLMSHVDKMLQVYKALCMESENPEEMRRWKVLYLRYIDEKKLRVEDIAKLLSVERRTIFRDTGKALEDLAVLLFGIEAISPWKAKK